MSHSCDSDSWLVYLLECADGSYYCGVTTDLPRRLEEHNGLRSGGARYTRTRRPVRLLTSVATSDRSAACRLERAIKKLPRRAKLAYMAAQGGQCEKETPE